MANVLLLREPSIDTPDPYESTFNEAGYHPKSISVFETIYCNISHLKNIIKDGPKSQSFLGVIITSKRSCDAWRKALQLLQKSDIKDDMWSIADWCSVPFYVVGQATAAALRAVFAEFKRLGLDSLDARGQDSGSAASLVAFILRDMSQREAKFLYLAGDKNRDTISRLLSEGGAILEQLTVYRTQGSLGFEDKLTAALASLPKDSESWWIIYFAPSAASFVTAIIRKHFYLEGLTSALISNASNLPPAKVAAIGATTNAFLHDELHLRVHATPEKPTPEDLVFVLRIATSHSSHK